MISEVPVIVRDLDRTKVEYLGRYKVVKMIGQGTFGTVYKCLTYKGYEYAIKQIHNVRMKKMMKNELDALMSVCSKYVVRYYELFYDKNDQPCIVLELCDGGSLADFSRKFANHSIPEKLSLQIFTKVLLGFQLIHKANLIHRDVKLQNVMMKGDTPKIGDFGLATQQKMQEIKSGLFSNSTSNNGSTANSQPNSQQQQQQLQNVVSNISNNVYTVAGTPAYMAPEVLQGTEQNQQVDIWSLGVMLLAMLFGDFPFYDSTIHGQMEKIRKICYPQFKYDLIRKSRHQVISDDTLQLLTKMIVIDPQKRATLQELLALPVIISHMDKEDLVEQMKLQGEIIPKDIGQAQQEGAEAKRSLLRSLNSLKVDGSPTVMKLKLFDFSDSLQKSKMHAQAIKQQQEQSGKGQDKCISLSKSTNELEESSEEDMEDQENNTNQGISIKDFGYIETGKKETKSTLERGNKVRPLVAEEALVPYNQMLNRITLLVDTYELFAEPNEYITAEFKDPEMILVLYFLSRVILLQFQGLNKILDERENLFQIDNWSSFIFSKSYLSIQASVQSEMQIWMEKADMLFSNLKEIDLVEFDSSETQQQQTVPSMTQVDSVIVDAEAEEEREREERRAKQQQREIARKLEKEKEKERLEQLEKEKQAEKERLLDRSGGVEKGTIASENKRKLAIAKLAQQQQQQQAANSHATQQSTSSNKSAKSPSDQSSIQQPNSPKDKLTLLKDIIDAILPPLESTVPADYSFKSANIPDDLKIAFRAVLLTAYTRLNNTDFLLESPPAEHSPPTSPPVKIPNSKQRISMSNLPSLNFISNSNMSTTSTTGMQSTKNAKTIAISLKSPSSSSNNNASMSCLKSVSQIAPSSATNKLGTTSIKFPKINNNNSNSTAVSSINSLAVNNSNNSLNSIFTSNNNMHVPSSSIVTSIKEIGSSNMNTVLPFQQPSQIPKRGSFQSQFSSSSHLTVPKVAVSSMSKSPVQSASQKQIQKMDTIVAPHLISGNKSSNNDQQYSRALARANEFFNKKKSEKQRIQDMKLLERKRYGLRILLSTVANHFILLTDQNIQLEDFQEYLVNAHADKTPTQKLKNEDILKALLSWLREIEEEKIKAQTEIVFNTFLPQIKQFNISFF